MIIAERYPKVINAPGGRINSKILVVSGNRLIPKILLAPRSSRTQPKRVRAPVKPSPIPIPSKMLANGEFLQAKLSARPKMIQFTTISGINRPNA